MNISILRNFHCKKIIIIFIIMGERAPPCVKWGMPLLTSFPSIILTEQISEFGQKMKSVGSPQKLSIYQSCFIKTMRGIVLYSPSGKLGSVYFEEPKCINLPVIASVQALLWKLIWGNKDATHSPCPSLVRICMYRVCLM